MSNNLIIVNPIIKVIHPLGSDEVQYAPGTSKIIPGGGEQDVKVFQNGPSVSTAFVKNLDQNFGEVTFSVKSTKQYFDLIKTWKNANNNCTILVSAKLGNEIWKATFINMAMVNNYEIMLGGEGAIECIFRGDPAI